MASNEIDLGEYKFIRHGDKLLGAGGFGRVYSGERKAATEGSADRDVAVKEVQINVHTARFINREKEFMRRLQVTPHENVIRFFHSVEMISVMYFVLELCTLGDLNRFMKTQTENTFNLCMNIFHCTSAGLRHLHKRIRVCHRDIKPGNILVTGTRSDVHFKIADLGFARPIESDSSTNKFTRKMGTFGWMAPEMTVTLKSSDSYSFLVDVFSLGLLFESVFRYRPRGHLEFHEGKIKCSFPLIFTITFLTAKT